MSTKSTVFRNTNPNLTKGKTMKKKILAMMIAVGVISSAHAQFGNIGGMLGGGKSSGGGDVSVMVDEFNKDSSMVNEAVTYSLIQIVAALGDKRQIAAVKAISDNLTKTTDPKERGSIQGTAIKEQATVAQELLKSQEAKAKVEKLSPEMQKKVSKSIFAVGIAALRIPGMMDKGRKIMEGVGSNPMAISSALPVKEGMSVFADAMPKMPTIVSTGLSLMRDVKMDPGNPTIDAKLEVDKSLTIPG